MKQEMPVRLLDTSDADSVLKLTNLLDACYRARAKKGGDYLPSGQDEQTTRRRIEGKEVWVCEINGRMLGTFTIAPPGNAPSSWWYGRPGIAEVSQVAVHPAFRMSGIFPLLMDAAEKRAVELGSLELAGTVPTKRKKLIGAYLGRGARIVDYKWKKNAKYGSVIWSKPLGQTSVRSPLFSRLARKLKYFRRSIKYKFLPALKRPQHTQVPEDSTNSLQS
jgi:GNAT superfamily N-acetyltransferase